jgi:hypothetical protein
VHPHTEKARKDATRFEADEIGKGTNSVVPLRAPTSPRFSA